MKKLLLFWIFVGCASAQSTFNALHQPDCIIAFSLTGTANTAAFDNRGVGCSGWSIQFSNYNFSPVSVALQSAPNNNGSPGTWVTFAGQSICNGGSNPSSSTTTSAAWLTGYNPFVRVSATLTGTGLLQGTALGWKDPALVCPVVSATFTPSGTQDVNLVEVGGAAVSLGQTTMAKSIPVVIPSDQSAVPVQIAGDGTVLSGQQAVTGSAVALGTNTTKTACVKALIGNTINVYVGPSGITTSTGMELAPGQSVCLPVTNTNLLFVIASTTGASVSWIATN